MLSHDDLARSRPVFLEGQGSTMASIAPALLASDPPPSTLAAPLRALWWLKKGNFAVGPEWKTAHELCQQREGDHDHDLVHALAHWIEGDASNSAYWYRRAGETRAASIEEEWQRIAEALSR
jgi:hypothetical protein